MCSSLVNQIFSMYPELRKGILECWIIVGYIVGFVGYIGLFYFIETVVGMYPEFNKGILDQTLEVLSVR